MINENEELPGAILVGLKTENIEFREINSSFEHSMTEMKALIEACDMEVVSTLTQVLEHPEAGTYLGKGKARELAEMVEEYKAQYCVFEGNLSPAQMKNLQDITGVPVWDRTNLILEIFSRRAKTREAKLQVESAYLQFMLPRLTGMWQHLGRQGGSGSGGGGGRRSSKGIGETQLELDRRQINHRIHELSKELETLDKTRTLQRKGRERGLLPSVALVGYTNAGKSSLMNHLLSLSEENTPLGEEKNAEKKVFEKDMLFATLDTSIRRIYTPNKKDFLLSDTVGFIENLPHGLVKAFRSTLEETKYADLLLIVLDSADPYHKNHKAVTENTLKDLEAGDVKRLYVMNKSDLLPPDPSRPIVANENTIYISTKTGSGISELLEKINELTYGQSKHIEALLPFSRGDLLNSLHKCGAIVAEQYAPDGIKITADCPPHFYDELSQYAI
ncbi:MAG: GTPase HflX [Lachnospiraceae bacterium]|nr:GTPase HflX [Lachnospiraceae bacterium]